MDTAVWQEPFRQRMNQAPGREILFDHEVRQDRKSSTCQKCREDCAGAVDTERRRPVECHSSTGIIGEGPMSLPEPGESVESQSFQRMTRGPL